MTKRHAAKPSLFAGSPLQADSSPADKSPSIESPSTESPSDNGSDWDDRSIDSNHPLIIHGTKCLDLPEHLRQAVARETEKFDRRQSFMGAVAQEIKDRLGELGRGDENERSRFARAARKWPTSKIVGVEGIHYPGLVIQLGYPPPGMNSAQRAREYLLDPDSSFRLVVRFDIEYQDSKKATISWWRSQYTKRDDAQEEFIGCIAFSQVAFRNVNGIPGNDDGLRFTLNDLAGEVAGSELSKETLDHEIHLSCAVLWNCLDRAERRHSMLRNETATPQTPRTGAIKRRRSEPSEETSTQEDKTRPSDERGARKKAAATYQTKPHAKLQVSDRKLRSRK